ncbi:MAG: hypothetical protein KatS3mg029_0017 [Saprospiraceae bacterium]|nr:MAG: hypothetical protein KatS3mg029_0017 [Saprospiraceae bacterium]
MLYQLKGGVAGKDVLVCINFAGDPLDVDHTIDGSNFPVGTQFNQVAGNTSTPVLTVGSGYWVNIKVPARSYAVWVQGAPLPVELIDFRASRQGENDVLLQWSSASESDFDAYWVERADDGQTFEAIARIEGSGGPDAGSSYSYIDRGLAAGKTWYFRLRMDDLDGSVHYSPLRTVEIPAAAGKFRLWPNPARKLAFLEIDMAFEAKLRVRLLDCFGREAMPAQVLETPSQPTTFTLPLEGLAPGVYVLQVEDARQILHRQKLVVGQ